MCAEGDDKPTWVRLKDVLYIPELRTNLASCRALPRNGIQTLFKMEKCVLQDQIQVTGVAYEDGGLYKLHAKLYGDDKGQDYRTQSVILSQGVSKMSRELWH